MKNRKESRLVGAVVPSIPVWNVYRAENGELFTIPILFYTVRESYLEDGSTFADMRAVPFSHEYLDEDDPGASNHLNLLGHSMTAEVKPEDWPLK